MTAQQSGKSGGTPAAPATGAAASAPAKKRDRKTPEQSRAATVERVRKSVGKAVAQLQGAEIRRTGKLSGNAELVSAYEAFDAQLAKIGVAPAATQA